MNNNDIRPMSEAPTVVEGSRESTVPESPKKSPEVHVQPVADARDASRMGRTPTPDFEHGLPDELRHRQAAEEEGIDWHPGFKNQFPWIGFAGLCVVITATSLAIAVLGQSNHKRVDEWPTNRYKTQPNVLLNIANQVQNLGLITLIAQGLAVAWWRAALKGSSLGTLHRNHAYSTSFYSIITSGKHFNIISLAALMTKFAVIDSTLFQKATKTQITQQDSYMNVSVTAWNEQKWSPNSGGIPGDEGNIKTVDAAWAGVITAYNGKIANQKLHDTLDDLSSFMGCPYRQECTGSLKGLGFAFNCSTTTSNINYGLQRQSQQGGVSSSYPLWSISFNSSWATDSKPYASILMDMLYVNSHSDNATGSCPGTLTKRTCDIRPATVQYPIIVMVPSQEELAGKNIVTHVKYSSPSNTSSPIGAPLANKQIDKIQFLEYNDLNEGFNTTSTVGALTYIMNNLFSSSANLTYDSSWGIVSRGSSAQTTFYADNEDPNADKCWYDIGKTGNEDPGIDLLRKINTLSFVASMYHQGAPTKPQSSRASQGITNQTFLASVTGIVEEYETNYGYVAGALVATLITVLCVLPVYWGFWQLGRKVTLSPLEITNAFGAPLTKPDQTKAYHGDFEQVLEDIKDRRVQYGQIREQRLGNMGIAEPTRVAQPTASHTWGHTGPRSARKIGIGAAVGGLIGATIGGVASKE